MTATETKMQQGQFIGKRVKPVKEFTVPYEAAPGCPCGEQSWGPKDIFVLEHDFRYAHESDGIHLGCPDGTWMACDSAAYAEFFGEDQLAWLDELALRTVPKEA